MYCEKCFAVIIIIILVCLRYESFAINSYACGIDNSKIDFAKEGEASIETYPWLGVLIYPMDEIINEQLMTTIVLISRQMALAAALDIDRYPKNDFRSLSRVVLGRNCSGPYIKVLDYNYHPDYTRTTYNTLAMLQLETLPVWRTLGLRSICPPPNLMRNAEVYAMTLTDDCTSTMVRIYKMEYVDPNECQDFYRRVNLDMESMWPTHVACARAARGGHCVWRSGTVLVMRDHDQWRLVGFGVNGPGCEAPARFLDYGMYHPWVKQSVSRIGRPAVTRLGPGHIVLRRSLNRLQRFGACDKEETQAELFTDLTKIRPVLDDEERWDIYHENNTVSYNVTLMSNVDYSCVSLRVYGEQTGSSVPRLMLRRWCNNPNPPPCFIFSMLQLNFFAEIFFVGYVAYEVKAYGREIKFIDYTEHKRFMSKLYYTKNATINTMSSYHSRNFYTREPVLDVLIEKTGTKSAIQAALKKLKG